jgi:hypothetical protein
VRSCGLWAPVILFVFQIPWTIHCATTRREGGRRRRTCANTYPHPQVRFTGCYCRGCVRNGRDADLVIPPRRRILRSIRMLYSTGCCRFSSTILDEVLCRGGVDSRRVFGAFSNASRKNSSESGVASIRDRYRSVVHRFYPDESAWLDGRVSDHPRGGSSLWRCGPRHCWRIDSRVDKTAFLTAITLGSSSLKQGLNASSSAACYGGKLKDLSEVKTQTVTTFVLRLFSTSEASGIGENGLMATLMATEFEPSGPEACRIL